MIELIISIVILFFVIIVFIIGLIYIMTTKEQQKEQQNQLQLEGNYMKPAFKPLSAEQIEDIHSRGKITPAEKVKEWERMGKHGFVCTR